MTMENTIVLDMGPFGQQPCEVTDVVPDRLSALLFE